MIELVDHYPHVFTPLKVGPLTLKNRIQWSPMVSALSTAYGEVTPEYIDFISMQARAGVGLVTIGATAVDEENGQDYPGELLITRDECIGGLYKITDAAHRYGAKISVEMCHAGRGADGNIAKTPYAIAPTAMPIPYRTKFVKAMDQGDIDRVIEAYADCAARLYKAGFDMCMIHAAHGNLLSQFLSPATNHREDDYGGTPENRWRFPLEVCKAVRDRVGNKMAVEMRISADEIMPEGMRLEDTLAFLKEAQQYIDLVHVSKGLIVDKKYSYHTIPPYYHPYCHNVHYAEAAKQALNIPVATVGSIKNLDMAEEILAGNKADVVAMGRALLTDPGMLKKSRAGHPEQVRPCLRCLQMCDKNVDDGKPIRCAVNPRVGHEGHYSFLQPAVQKKKAVVVGGGAAGMMAAQTLTERGHHVVLFEAKDHLGGHLPNICCLPFKDDLKQYCEWDVRTTMNCGADIRLNTKATPELIQAENPDVLVLATGSVLLTPPVPGINGKNVVDVISVDSKKVATGQKVVVCGGGMSGLECALGLAMEGKDVTVVDMVPVDKFAGEIVFFTRNMLLAELQKYGVKLVGDSKVEAITEQGVETIDRNWKRVTYEADTVVSAFGLKSNTENFDVLTRLVPETYIVGDCGDGAKSIGNANYGAFHQTVEV